MGFLKKLFSKIRASLYVFKKAEILRNVVNKEIGGEYDNLCHSCYFNERYHERAKLEGIFQPEKGLRISIYLGGALGDYIVYLRFVDEISSICKCHVDLFIDRIEFATYVYGTRENVTIIHDAQNCLFNDSCCEYDLAVHLDHGLTLRHCNVGSIREKAPGFYVTACKIVEYSKSHQINIANQHERETVILRRAKFLRETKWSKLSCGGAIDMESMYSNLLVDPAWIPALYRYQLHEVRYITVNYGADKNMGGTAQTKVLPFTTISAFIQKFKEKHPDILIVQTGVKNSMKLSGADKYAFDCRLEETAVILKRSLCHVDSEGGLVHMASQLSTPCVVSFGPTPVYYYGYPRNKNIVAPACSDCMSTTPQWSRVCPKGLQVPDCMTSISVEKILDAVEEVLLNRLPELQDSIKTIEAREMPDMPAACRIGIIASLTKACVQKAISLKEEGKVVEVFIPTHINDEIVEYRTILKKSGIKVEYGTAFNIARTSGWFDAVFCGRVKPEWEKYVTGECKRILTNNGTLIWIN